MNTGSLSRGSRLWGATVIVLGLSCSLFVTSRAAGEPFDARSLPIPADAIAAVHVRLADIWKGEALTDLRQLLAKAGPQALKAFDQRFVPAPSSLDRLTILVRPPAEAGREPAVAFYLSTSTPFDPDKLVKSFMRGSQAQQAGNAKYYTDEKAGVTLHVVNKQTILLGPPESVRAALEKPVRSGGPLEGTLKLATPTTPIVAGVNVAALPIPPQQVPPPFAPLLKAQLFTASVEIGKQLRVNLSMQFPDQVTADQGEQAVRAGIAMALQALPAARNQFEVMVYGKDKDSSGTLSELPEAIGGLFCLAMIQTAEEFLKEFPLERRATTLHTSVQFPAGFSVSNPATAAFAIGLLLPAVQKVREAANRVKDANNLKQIALAMHNYHDTYRRLPAAAICSKDGKPLLSWRVSLLPYLEEEILFKQFKLDEPWDSPNNKKLLSLMPRVYALPVVDSTTHTYYRVFVGPEAGFELQKGRRFTDITDGTSNTWMVVEAAEAVPWTKPDELVYDSKAPLPKLGNHVSGGFQAAFMDGSVRYFPRLLDEATMRALITHAGGEVIQLDK